MQPPASPLTHQGMRAASLVVLTMQNSLLTVLLHYSRTRSAPYSAATAVLLNEVIKGSISLLVAYRSCTTEEGFAPSLSPVPSQAASLTPALNASRSRKAADVLESRGYGPSADSPPDVVQRLATLKREVFSSDCWKLSIPAILYVVQNNLQFVAASNLDVATFQVSYQLKILTTALFSVILLKKRLNNIKWAALFCLALGVGIVQLQAGGRTSPKLTSDMQPSVGFIAVLMACVTSGLAGVYFEMVLKGSNADLWIRNVQLSLFSLVPALLPAIRPVHSSSGGLESLMSGFGFWAWSVVWCQVLGGLVTALVIKYSDNIVKGFATSLAIVLSSFLSYFLFADPLTPGFLLGAATVIAATYLYNRQPISIIATPAIDMPLQLASSQREPLLPTSSSQSSPRTPSLEHRDGEDVAIVAMQTGRPDSPFLTIKSESGEGKRRHGTPHALSQGPADTGRW